MERRGFFLNGIDALTGRPSRPTFDAASLARWLRGKPPDRGLVEWLRQVWRQLSRAHLGLPFGTDPCKLAEAGWGLLQASDESATTLEALEPLLAWRREQVPAERFKVLEVQPGEEARPWLARHGVTAGTVDPTRVPYYLLLVGSPERLPFELQHLLAVEHAVGRLTFDDPADCRRYAESVVEVERAATVAAAREAVVFATQHPHDEATSMSSRLLAAPLASDGGVVAGRGFEPRLLAGEAATRNRLLEVLHQPRPPALLFTATHGLSWPADHADQRLRQGALLCQDWPGSGRPLPRHSFAAADLPDDANVLGMVAFFFACFGAGTPTHDEFPAEGDEPRPRLAARPFVAELPTRLLAHPRGGSLAVIGHVERAWSCSFEHRVAGSQIQPFESVLSALLSGAPVGHALNAFRQRFAALSNFLAEKLEHDRFGRQVPDEELAELWLERADARNYIVLGDPAVRLRVELMR